MSVNTIKVYEENNKYLVKIHPSQKLRASRIVGRRWDSGLIAWVYPKTQACYEALKAEFECDSELFSIGLPETQGVSIPPKLVVEEGVSEDEWNDLTYKTADINDKFTSVSEKMDTLLKSFSILEASTNSIEKSLTDQRVSKQKLNMDVDIKSHSGLQVLEIALKALAYEASGRDKSFFNFFESHNPLTKPEKFVMRTHEHLLYELAAIAGEANPREANFSKYIHTVKDGNLVSLEKGHNVPSILFTLNNHRNNIIHTKGMSESELINRSIIYLMNVALIWKDIASEPVGD